MFTIGLLIGLYGYILFLFGLIGMLYAPLIWVFTTFFVIGSSVYWKKSLRGLRRIRLKLLQKDTVSLFLFSLLICQIGINIIGVLGPELGFDALWYHLTFPKLYLMWHSIRFIPGGTFSYSTMPKFLELLYTGGLAFGLPVFPKLIHFSFGILILITLYKFSRKFVPIRIALIVLLVFYSNLVVGWESISAYIDLGRTFFELLSFCAFIEWIEKENNKWLLYSSIFMGLAIATKLLAIASLILLLFFIIWVLWKKKKPFIKTISIYALIAFLIPLPWFVFSFIHTQNPFYPFFGHTYPISFPIQLLNPLFFIKSFWNLFLFSQDPLNPVYLILLPLLFIFFKKWPFIIQLICLYVAGGFLFWYITPQTGGGRFIIPYLPLLSLISIIGILSLKEKILTYTLFLIILVVTFSSIGYRAVANAKFIPVILGKESEAHFLQKNLNFSFGDFYDIDGYFRKRIKPTDTVLLYGFHNEYYIDFPFIDASFVKKGDVFNYIAVKGTTLPSRFQTWNLLYTNSVTHVALYSAGGIPWTY